MEATKKKSPNLNLRGEIGNYVIGEFVNRYESKHFPGTYSTLIKVEETNGNTTLWDGKKDIEVDIEVGDTVFLKETPKFFHLEKDRGSLVRQCTRRRLVLAN